MNNRIILPIRSLDVRDILKLLDLGVHPSEIARRYCTTVEIVLSLRSPNSLWKWVTA